MRPTAKDLIIKVPTSDLMLFATKIISKIMQLYSVTYCAKNTDPDTNSESVVMKVYDNIKHPTEEYFLKELFGKLDYMYEIVQFQKLKTE